MSKSKRGKAIKREKNWRGTCPLCQRTGVKIVWDKVTTEGKIKVCKVCGNN